MNDLTAQACVPCSEGAEPISNAERDSYLKQMLEWKLVIEGSTPKLLGMYKFSKYQHGIKFASQVGKLADQIAHHPSIVIDYKQVSVYWWTHKINNLHLNDFIAAQKVTELYSAFEEA